MNPESSYCNASVFQSYLRHSQSPFLLPARHFCCWTGTTASSMSTRFNSLPTIRSLSLLFLLTGMCCDSHDPRCARMDGGFRVHVFRCAQASDEDRDHDSDDGDDTERVI